MKITKKSRDKIHIFDISCLLNEDLPNVRKSASRTLCAYNRAPGLHHFSSSGVDMPLSPATVPPPARDANGVANQPRTSPSGHFDISPDPLYEHSAVFQMALQ